MKLLIAIGYSLIIIICSYNIFHIPGNLPCDHINKHRTFWTSITLILIMITAARIFNVPTEIINYFRIEASKNAWYQERYSIQLLLIMGAPVAALIVFSLAEKSLHDIWQRNYFTLGSLLFLICFIIIKTVSFHPIDNILNWKFGNIKLDHFIEILSVAWINISLLYGIFSVRMETPKNLNQKTTRCI